MIREITPVNVWIRALTAYIVGLISSATAVGFAAGWLGSKLKASVLFNTDNHLWLALLASITLAYGLHELGIIRLPMPQIPWQVPVTWTRYGKIGQGFLYGTVLGAEVFTFMPYASFYIILLFEMSLGLPGGAVLGFAYGIARAMPTVASSLYIRVGNQEVNEITANILFRMPQLHTINGLILTLTGESLLMGILLNQWL